jgi:hypothetical protein
LQKIAKLDFFKIQYVIFGTHDASLVLRFTRLFNSEEAIAGGWAVGKPGGRHAREE